jgi:hypothetical protein
MLCRSLRKINPVHGVMAETYFCFDEIPLHRTLGNEQPHGAAPFAGGIAAAPLGGIQRGAT